MVTIAKMKPVIAPPIPKGITAEASLVSKYKFQVKAADNVTSSNKIPVLLTVPCKVMKPPPTESEELKFEKVASLRVGFPERPNI